MWKADTVAQKPAGTCRSPCGCTAARLAGRSYCAIHHRLYHQPVRDVALADHASAGNCHPASISLRNQAEPDPRKQQRKSLPVRLQKLAHEGILSSGVARRVLSTMARSNTLGFTPAHGVVLTPLGTGTGEGR